VLDIIQFVDSHSAVCHQDFGVQPSRVVKTNMNNIIQGDLFVDDVIFFPLIAKRLFFHFVRFSQRF